MNTMSTDEILKAYTAQQEEEQALIESKNAKIRAIAESRQKAENRKTKIEEIKKKIIERRDASTTNKKTLKEEEEPKYEIEGEKEEFVEEEDVEEVEEVEDEEEIEGEEEVEDEEEIEEVEKEEVEKLPESKQAILKKIAERKKQDILKKIAERKVAAEAESKKEKVEEKKEPVKEKKEVRVGTLLEAAEGDKKRRFSVYREEKSHFFLKELGSGKTFKIAKEKVELI